MPDEAAVFEIEFCSGPRDGEIVAVRADQAIVGRGRDIDVEATGDKNVSGRQAKIAVKEGRILVEDLGGSATTSVNGEVIPAAREVTDQDVVCIGRTELVVRRPAGQAGGEEVSVSHVSRRA